MKREIRITHIDDSGRFLLLFYEEGKLIFERESESLTIFHPERRWLYRTLETKSLMAQGVGVYK